MKKFKDKKVGLIVVVVKLVGADAWTPGRGSEVKNILREIKN